ncbi:effector from type III secretion system family protein [Chlamydia psittaci]|uniref:Effector from type III secretion system family protein n=1 Tax=Chlamydophila parapsittaci TaxID=344886 RepID=A0ABX5VXB6_9CHLA|nr:MULTISPECIES: CT620/CT621 family type III secretion system effector [Chlamydia]QDE37223.1 effector from type III secretion system family protein [Chlamydophila parapsittaci]QHE18883.1 effector from type III secretion system family protein [Chlamydia psittaci]UOB75775.1 effector from type III secretion system family protein [Chlamydia psittaci]
MSSFYIQNRPKTVSGDGLFNIKLDHKFSNFNPKAQPAIDIETLNSGLYALKRLASIIEAGNIHASMLLNPNNTIFPSPPIAPKPHSVKLIGSAQSTAEAIAGIQGTTAVTLVPLILDGLQTFIESTSEVNLAQISSIILSIALITPLKDKPSLSLDEQKKVFSNCYQPQKKDILNQIKKEQATEIQKGKDALSEKLTSAGATEEEIQKALKEYEDKFTSDFFDAHVEKQYMTYRSTIGGATSKMMNDIKALAVSVPKPNKDNVNSVNGMVMLHAIFNGLTDAVNKEPALGGEEEVIKTQLTLSGYLSKESLTEEELQVIYTASQLPSKTTLDAYLKPRDAAIYREGITAAYQSAVQNLTSVRSDIENEKQTLENQLATFQQAVSCFTSWVNGSKTITEAKEYTSEIITAAMEASAGLNSLSQMQANLQESEKTIFTNYVPKYLDLTIGNETKVTQFIAKIDSFQEISEYTLNNAVTSDVTVKTVLKQKAEAIKNNPFYSTVSQQITTIANNALTNYIQDNGGYQIPKFNEFVQTELKSVTSSSNGFSEQAATVLHGFKTAADSHITQLQQQIAALEKKYTDLNPANASFTDERKIAVESWLNSESLGSAFIYLILNSQLPKQSAFLNPLIEEINFNNLAANAINDLLKITNHFSTTSVYYNLSSYLIQSKEGENLFCGDYFETCLALSREKEYIARDTDRCRRAQAFVNALLEKIKQLEGISSSQQSEMLDATSNYMYSLSITFNQLNVLNALLSNLKITPEKNGEDYKKTVFKIEGPKDWIPTLASLEGFISNGFPHSTPTGGLGPLFTQIQSDQQNYTTQGQTQQLNLQNQMTNVQQEWTLVSTSMQVLNQILSKLVGEIYPN